MHVNGRNYFSNNDFYCTSLDREKMWTTSTIDKQHTARMSCQFLTTIPSLTLKLFFD